MSIQEQRHKGAKSNLKVVMIWKSIGFINFLNNNYYSSMIFGSFLYFKHFKYLIKSHHKQRI